MIAIVSTENDITRAAYQSLISVQVKDFDDNWRAQLLQLHENTLEELRTMQSITTDPQVKRWLDKTIPIVEQHRNFGKKGNKATQFAKGANTRLSVQKNLQFQLRK